MTYLEHVTTYFLALVGKGVALSSQDVALVSGWQKKGIPAGAVCTAVRRSFDRAGRPSRFSLADCSRDVDRIAVERAGSGQGAGPSEQPWTPSLLRERLSLLGQTTDEGPLREAYRTLYRYLKGLPDHAMSAVEVARLDGLAVRYLEKELPSGLRARARAKARKRAREVLPESSSREAQKGLAGSLLERYYCEEHGLTVPSELLIAESDE